MKKQELPDFVSGNDYFSVYPSEKMTIFITRRPCPVFRGEFAHRNYEFIVSLSPVTGFVVDGNTVSMPKDALLPVNSEQAHGTRFLLSDISFMNLQFEAEFIAELFFRVYGVQGIRFPNTVVPCGEEIPALAARFIEEYEQRREGYTSILSSLSVQLAIALFRQTGISGQIAAKPAKDFVTQTIEHFAAHYEECFSLDALSEMVNMSKYHFARRFKDMTGKTPYSYFQDIRIMKSLELLSNPANRVIDVALQCGFNNHSHFTRLFRERTGLTPTAYRARILAQRR